MGHERLRVVIVHNRDFDPATPDPSDPDLASKADVVNAARDVADALRSRGHEVETLPVPATAPAEAALETVRALERRRPDLVFNLCESLGGDNRHEALLPALLDLAGLPYTGSGPLALSLALRKDLSKRLLAARGVPTPEAVALDSDDVSQVALPFPLIVKPAREDASVGIDRGSVVRDRPALAARVALLRARYRQPVLVERFVDGREIYVSLVGNDTPEALPMHEIDFAELPTDRPRIVTYDGKWDPGSDDYRGTTPVKAVLDEPLRLRLEAAARGAFAALELRDYARCDLRVDGSGAPFVIDVNPNCDLSASAGVARAAGYGGISYPDLIERICRAALARNHEEGTPHVDRDRPSAAAPDDPAAARAAVHPAT